MKRLFKYAFMLIVFFIVTSALTYAFIAGCAGNYNFTTWGQDARLGFGTILLVLNILTTVYIHDKI